MIPKLQGEELEVAIRSRRIIELLLSRREKAAGLVPTAEESHDGADASQKQQEHVVSWKGWGTCWKSRLTRKPRSMTSDYLKL